MQVQVEFTTCDTCGAVTSVNSGIAPSTGNREMHEQWHKRQNELLAARFDNAAITKPGGTLVIGYHCMITMAEADAVTRRLNAAMPDVKIVLVDSIAELAVCEPGEAPVIRTELPES